MSEDKREIAAKIIKLRQEIILVKEEAEEERRDMKKDFNRKIQEVKVLAIGNKTQIKKIWRRTDDNTEHLEKMQSILQIIFKVIVTTTIALLITAIFNFTMKNL